MQKKVTDKEETEPCSSTTLSPVISLTLSCSRLFVAAMRNRTQMSSNTQGFVDEIGA